MRLSKSYWIKSGLFALAQRLSVALCTILSFLILVRLFSKAQQGIYDLFLVTAGMIELLKLALIKNASVAFINSKKMNEQSVYDAAFWLNTGFSATAIALICIFAPALSRWLDAPELSGLLIYYIPAMLLLVVFNHFEVFFFTQANFRAIFFIHLTRQATVLLCVALLAIYSTLSDIRLLILIQTIGIIGGTAVGFRLAHRHLRPPAARLLDKQTIVQMLQFGKYVFGTNLSSTIYRSADRYLIAAAIGPIGTALYGVSGRITNMIDLPSGAISEISFPKTVKAMAEQGKQGVAELFEWAVAANMVFLLPATLLAMLIPEMLLWAVAGKDYTEAAEILRWILLAGLFIPFFRQFGNTLDAVGRPELNFRVNLIIAFFCIGFEILFIRLLGKSGAAIGLLAGTSCGALVAYQVLQKQVPVRLRAILGKIGLAYRNIYLKMLTLTNKQTTPTNE
ncbi:oligosaccharide flippase family protein [Rhodoflexus sp.]